MTVPTSDNREQYPGNDSATEFDYTFKIFQASDLVVTLTTSDGTETTLVRGTDYSVDGVGNENGGSVIYPLSGDPLATGETLTILREIPVVQETDLRNQGRYYPETLEDEFDRSRMIDQQQQEQLGRTLSRTRASDYFDAKGRRIANVGDATEDQDAYTKGQADARFANDVITQTGGEWDAKSEPLGNLGNPQNPDHATTKAYVDGRFDTDVITKTGTHWDAELQQIRNLQTRQPPSSTDAMNFGATSQHVASVLNSADPQVDGWQRVRWVNTISDLQALDTSELVDGQQVQVKEYHAGTGIGGGEFYWDADRDKAKHNGGTVIDPERITAWDGTHAGLATFFTAGSGVGCFVRRNPERASFSEFGALESKNNFPSLSKAAYSLIDCYVDVANSDLDAGTDNLISINPEGLYLHGDGYSTLNILSNIFDATASSKGIKFEGLRFTSETASSSTILAGSGDSGRLDRVESHKCEYSGTISLLRWSGDGNADPSVTKFGIEEFSFTNNICNDIDVSFIVAVSVPIENIFIGSNYIHNFKFVFINIGIINGTSNAASIREINKIAAIDGNTVYCDDTFFPVIDSGSYYAFVLVENSELIYQNNHVEGMKTHSSIALYDVYGSSSEFISRNNTYKNNACLTTEDISWAIRALCKVKGGAGGLGNNVFSNNHYIIEPDIHTKWGVDENLVAHSLSDYREDGVAIRNCTFKLKTLYVRSSSSPCDFLDISNNTITAEKVAPYISTITSLGDLFSARDDSGTFIINNNRVHISQITGSGNDPIYLFRAVLRGQSGQATISRNILTTDSTHSLFYPHNLYQGMSLRSLDADNYSNSVASGAGGATVKTAGVTKGLDYTFYPYSANNLIEIGEGRAEVSIHSIEALTTFPRLRTGAPAESSSALSYVISLVLQTSTDRQELIYHLYMHRDSSGVAYMRYQRNSDDLWYDQQEGAGDNYNPLKAIKNEIVLGSSIAVVSNVTGDGLRIGSGLPENTLIRLSSTGARVDPASMPAATN